MDNIISNEITSNMKVIKINVGFAYLNKIRKFILLQEFSPDYIFQFRHTSTWKRNAWSIDFSLKTILLSFKKLKKNF